MSDLKEAAKKIIAKGKLLNDPELINMGLDMLDGYQEPDYKDGIIQPHTESITMVGREASKSNITDQFRVENRSPIDTKFGRKVSVSTESRENKWFDDRTEATEDIGKTPPVQRTQKRRAVNKVEVICTTCGKKQKVLKELLYTESYRCDSCILKGKV